MPQDPTPRPHTAAVVVLPTEPSRRITPLRRVMFERQITAVRLGAATGYSPKTITAVAGGVTNPWPKARRTISAALQMPEHALFPDPW